LVVLGKKMLLTISKTNQQNLFYSSLSDMLDMNNSLIALANVMIGKYLKMSLPSFILKMALLLNQ
jgi:hypothetical protein